MLILMERIWDIDVFYLQVSCCLQAYQIFLIAHQEVSGRNLA